MNTTKKFLGIALVLSVLSIWGIAQTSQTGDEAQKTEAGIAVTQGKNAQSLTNSQLLSSAGTIIATNDGVTITQGPGASIPEGPEPQGGWFTPRYTAEGVVKREYFSGLEDAQLTLTNPFSFSMGDNRFWKAYCLKNRAIKSLHFWRSAFIMRRLFGHGWLRVQEIRVNQLSLRGYFEP